VFTGAIFPLDVLPEFLRPIGLVFPITYWLEVARRALLGENAATFPTLARYSNGELLVILLVMSVVLLVGSYVIYRWSLHRAKETGRIDMESSF
jgi:ABC-2 type transport system permease protein